MTRLALFLGAGFSYISGMPMASQLFDEVPEVDRFTRRRLVNHVISGWRKWKSLHGGEPEQFLGYLDQGPELGYPSIRWAAWYVALVIALRTGQLELVGGQPKIIRDSLTRRTRCVALDLFWDALFKCKNPPKIEAVITTNYDIQIERDLRLRNTPLRHRPGFNYGLGPEVLRGGGYPSFTHLRPIRIAGDVPVLKLHGSISWALESDNLIKYHDCRPAIRGDPAIIAPVPEKNVPSWLEIFWRDAEHALTTADHWLFVGYGLPDYDRQIYDLLKRSFERGNVNTILMLNPSSRSSKKLKSLLPSASIEEGPGLPEGVGHVKAWLKRVQGGAL